MVKSAIRKILNSISYYKISSEDYILFRKNYKLLLFTEFKNLVNSDKLDYKFLIDSKSQLIQDLIVLYHFDFKKNGTFVELGAHDGFELSNTHILENSFFWNGVLIEPVKSSFNKLINNRKTICLNKVVYNKKGNITFQEDLISELSTIKEFSNSDLHKRKKKIEYEIESITLNEIFKDYLNTHYIDFLSLDTEGSEYTILKELDHNEYRFGLICVEHNFTNNREKINTLLIKNGYRRVYENFSKWDDFYIPLQKQ